MAFPAKADGTWVNPSSFDAAELRRADAALMGGDGSSALGVRGGVVRHSDNSLKVTVNGSDVVTVQPGCVVIPGNAVSGAGPYRAGWSSSSTGSLAARDATNGRIDLVVARQLDTDVVPTHGDYTSQIEIIAGAPSATPAVPSLPSMAVELGRITVPAVGGGSASVDLSQRQFASAAGGTLYVQTQSGAGGLPGSAPLRQIAVALDTGMVYRFDGSLPWTKLISERTQAGTTTCTTPSASTRYSTNVTFPDAFSSTPVVVVTPVVTWADTAFVSVSSRSATGFTLNWYRSTAGDFTCDWTAVPNS